MATALEKKTIAAMQSLGTYKPEFDPIIKVYCQLWTQYTKLTTKFQKSGYDCEALTATGTKKAPIVATLESLRKDLLVYAAQLGLTAAGLKKLKENALADSKKKSALASALEQIDEVRSG
jgi:P27 family predicted phage terminase small subunit